MNAIKTHLPLVPHICVSELGKHWFRYRLVDCSVPSQYFSQYCLIVNWTSRRLVKFESKYNSFSHENAFESVTVYSKKCAHGFCFAVLCCGYTLTDFRIAIRLTSLALWQSNDCLSASKATLMNMDKYFMWIHYERLHNHNKAKHKKTVCIFIVIDCICEMAAILSRERWVKYLLFSSIFKMFVSIFQNDVVWISSAEELENKFSQLRQPLISARIFPTKSQRQEYPYFQQTGCSPGCPARIVDHNVPLEERSSCPFNFTHNVDPTRYPHTLLMAVCCKGQCARVGGHRHHQQQHSCQPLMQQVQVLRREHPQILNTAAGYYKVVAETVPVACLCAPANRGE